MLKLDLHVHTSHSVDGMFSVREMVEAAKKKGLNGIAVTDHNTTSGLSEAARLSSGEFLVIPGMEISSGGAHVVALGIREVIPKGLPLKETVDRIKGQGGVAVAAHPFVPGRNPNAVSEVRFDAIEALNSRAFFLSNPLARRYAKRANLPSVAGSDAHHAEDVGTAYTCVECRPVLKEVLDEIRAGRTSIEGRALPVTTLLWRFVQRTFTRRR